MKLNKWHREIISDRPVECVIETIYDNDEKQFEITKAMTEDEAVDYITGKLESWAVAESIDFADLNLMEQEILWNVVSLSTAACSMLDVAGDPTGYERDYKAICKAGRELANELNRIGVESEFSLI